MLNRLAKRQEAFEAYLLDIPQLHTWDDGVSWNAGGFGIWHFRAIFDLLQSCPEPVRVLETGAGNSTICFLLAGASRVTSIAPDEALFGRIRAYCASAGIDTAPLETIFGAGATPLCIRGEPNRRSSRLRLDRRWARLADCVRGFLLRLRHPAFGWLHDD